MGVYDIVTERIVDRMEKAEKKGEKFYWVKPFSHGTPDRPYCYETGEPYKGINRVLLEPDEYTTFNKVKQHNEKYPNDRLSLRKGAKSSIAIYFGYKEAKDNEGNIKYDKNGEAMKKPFVRYYNLFSRQDILNKNSENLPSKFPVTHYEHKGIADDNFLKFCATANSYCLAKGIDLQIITDGTQCCYSPSENAIKVPVVRNFDSVYEYASAVAHELCHSTGIELGRFNENVPSIEEYSLEELVAEIGAEMLMSDFKIEDDRRNKNNDIAYLKSWSEKLKSQPKAIMFAAQKAQKAAELISGYREKEQGLDSQIHRYGFEDTTEKADEKTASNFDFKDIEK